MITEKQWNKFVEMVNCYTDSYDIRELTEKEIIMSLMKHTTNAEGVASCFADNKKYRMVD